LLVSLDPFALELFGDFIPKGENVNIRSKRGKFDLGGVWMMVSIQASVSGSISVSFLQIYAYFGCVVINHQKGGDCSEHGLVCH
jgi:hypothetical protein